MRIVYALPVRGIEQLADGTFVLLGVESDIHLVPGFPIPVGIPLFATVACTVAEAASGQGGQFSLRVLGPDLSEVAAPMNIGLNLNPGPNTPEGWDIKTHIPTLVRFEAQEAGTYSIEVSLNGSSHSVPIIVREPPTSPST